MPPCPESGKDENERTEARKGGLINILKNVKYPGFPRMFLMVIKKKRPVKEKLLKGKQK